MRLRGLEPLAFWMQTIFLASAGIAQRRLARLLPAAIVAGCRWASLGVCPCWLFFWLFPLAFWKTSRERAASGSGTRRIVAGGGDRLLPTDDRETAVQGTSSRYFGS